MMVLEYGAICQENSANALILFASCNIWARESQNEMCTALHKVFTIFHARGNELPRATSINFQKIWRWQAVTFLSLAAWESGAAALTHTQYQNVISLVAWREKHIDARTHTRRECNNARILLDFHLADSHPRRSLLFKFNKDTIHLKIQAPAHAHTKCISISASRNVRGPAKLRTKSEIFQYLGVFASQ